MFLLGEVEVAVDLGAEPDGHPEERLHGGVMRRKADRIRVIGDAVGSHRLALRVSIPRSPGPSGSCPMASAASGGMPEMEELEEPAVLVEDSERTILGAGELHGRLDGGVQDRREVGLAGDRGGPFDELPEAIRRQRGHIHGGRLTDIGAGGFRVGPRVRQNGP